MVDSRQFITAQISGAFTGTIFFFFFWLQRQGEP
jgi:hypothetical protein